MDKRKRYRHAKPVIVQLKYLHGNDDDTGQHEPSSVFSGNWPLDRQLMANVKDYLRNGVLLLDIEESDLENITIRVGEQMVSDRIIETFDINNVSNVFLLTAHPTLKEPHLLEEHKSNGTHHNDTEIIEIQKLTCNNSNHNTNTQSESNQQLQGTGLVMVANANFILKPTISFVRLEDPVCFPQALDSEIPVRFLFVLLGPTTQDSASYLNMGNTLWTVAIDHEFRHEACGIKTKEDLITGIENVSKVKQPTQKEIYCEDEEHSNLLRRNMFNQKIAAFNPLLKTNRLWGGLINDITRRLPHYKSDFCDGLNGQVIAASIFLYFGVLSTAITFGGLMSSKTNNLMGISETLLSTSLMGIVFHLASSQPLMLVGGTGPLLLFDEALFQFCKLYEIDFLAIRIYIGMWLGLIAVTIAAFDGCVYLRLLTRFTQELFASLISLIFTVEAVFKVIDVFKTHPISIQTNDTNSSSQSSSNKSDDATSDSLEIYKSNTALFCAILSIGTFVSAYCLRVFRNSHFLGRGIRRAIGDFGVPISISIFVFLSYLVPQIDTEKLIVPEGLSPTNPNARSWIISFSPLSIWVPFASVIAAMLVYVFIFMETQISELIINSRGLKKGSGFHVDIVIICLVNVVFGFLGMPWQSGATIRSVTHVSAVTTIPERSKKSGESQQLIVKEQRVSGLLISICVGLSVIMAPILRNIPVSILYGVFFYMGIVSVSGVQFLHRIRLLFTPTKYHGTEAYVQRVPTWKMHTFTCVQVLALSTLWIVKSSKFALALPFVLLLMIPLKQKLATFYSAAEMAALDGNLPVVDVNDEPDFYEQSHLPA